VSAITVLLVTACAQRPNLRTQERGEVKGNRSNSDDEKFSRVIDKAIHIFLEHYIFQGVNQAAANFDIGFGIIYCPTSSIFDGRQEGSSASVVIAVRRR
jgi:hypothetical protein